MVVRSCGFPALEMPRSCATDPLPPGRRRQSGICGNLPSVGKAAEQPPDHRTPASSEPIPFKFFNVAPGAAAVELNRRTHLHCLPRYAVTNSERANSDQPPRSTCLTTRPSDITYARSEFCSATATFCSTRIKLIPRPRKLATTDTISFTTFGAKPVEGSSIISRSGFSNKARLIAIICCSPPLRRSTAESRRSSMNGNSRSTSWMPNWILADPRIRPLFNASSKF
jgi:hypothetical protein